MDYTLLKNNEERLRYFSDLYLTALAKRPNNFSDLKKQYLGERKLNYGNVEPRVIRNITFELIESEVSSNIPSPKAVGKNGTRKSEKNAEKITELLKNARDELPFEKLNDLNERNSYIYGTDFFFVEWDEEKDGVTVTSLSPEQVVVQPEQNEIEDMDYIFLTFDKSPDFIKEKYNKIVYSDSDSVEVIVCYFKLNCQIAEIVFTKEEVLSYIENYYAKRKTVCKNCGNSEKMCACGNYKPTKEIVLTEEITEDIEVSDGIIPKKSPKFVDGKMQVERVFDEKNDKYIDLPKLENTVIPIFTPNLYPIAVRKNICLSESFYGLSDAEMIWSEQQEINKLETRIMEKLLKAGAIPYSAESTDLRLTDEIYTRGIKIKNAQEKNLLGVLDLQVSISQDLTESERLYQQAKRILGISDSFQGLPDTTATSGVAKELLINQSGARLTSKRVMKNAFYADLDKIIFQFFVAFSKNNKKMAKKDAFNESVTNRFSKYDFLELNDDGEYFYNVDYMFSIDLTTDIINNKEALWSEIKSNYTLGTYGDTNSIQAKICYWQNMERAKYPFAKENVQLLISSINSN